MAPAVASGERHLRARVVRFLCTQSPELVRKSGFDRSGSPALYEKYFRVSPGNPAKSSRTRSATLRRFSVVASARCWKRTIVSAESSARAGSMRCVEPGKAGGADGMAFEAPESDRGGRGSKPDGRRVKHPSGGCETMRCLSSLPVAHPPRSHRAAPRFRFTSKLDQESPT